MDITQLNYFRTVAKEGSFKKAADLLFISRQGLTKAIHKLEQELEVPLFEVTPKGVVLTKYGQSLYNHVDSYIRYHQKFLNELQCLKTETVEDLKIGIQAGFSEGLGKDFLANFVISNPDLHIQIHSFPKISIQNDMQQHDMQVWITTDTYDENTFHSICKKKRHLFLIVSNTHPLASKKSVSLKDIMPYSLIGLPHDIGQKGRTETAINNNKMKLPDYTLDAADRNLTMRLVESGMAVSFNAGWHYQDYPGIMAVPLKDFPIELEVNVLIRNDRPIHEALKRFIKYTKNSAK